MILSRDFLQPFAYIKIKVISIHLMPHYDKKFRTCAASTETFQVIIIRLVKVLVSVSFSLGLDIETLKISVSVSVSKLRL